MANLIRVSNESFAKLFSLPSALAASALLYAWTLTYPINIDSSVHAYMASLILKGYWPYISVWENNFPGTIVFVHLPEMILLGRSAIAFHAWDILWQLAGIFFLYKIMQRVSNRPAAWLGCVLAAIFYLSMDNLMVAQRDCYATVILLATIYILYSNEGESYSHKRVFWCGFVCGIAILIRPTNELFALFMAVWILYEERKLTNGVILFGATQILLIVFVFVTLITGSFTEVYTVIIRFNSEVYSHFLPIAGLFYPFGKYWILLIGIPFGIVAVTKRNRVLFSAITIASLLTIVPQKRYFYQYDTTFVLLIILSAIGWVWLFERVRVRQLRLVLPIMFAVGALALLTRGTTQKRILLQSIHGNMPDAPIYWQYDTSSASGFAILDSVGDYLASHSGANDPIQFIGEYVYPLYYANRLPATRFVTFHSIMLRNSSGQLADFQIRWRKELLDTLKSSPPVYIVVPDAPEYARGHLNGLLGHEILEKDLTGLGQFVGSSYHFEARIGAFTFYRRN
jgi:hypothetical protein